MKQSLYLGIFTAFILHLSVFASEHYRQSLFTGLMAEPQLRIISFERNYGYTLERSKVSHVTDTSLEGKDTKVESYLAVFHEEGMVTYSYFHEGPNAGQLFVYLEDPTKKPLKGQDADFNYLKKRYLENKTQK